MAQILSIGRAALAWLLLVLVAALPTAAQPADRLAEIRARGALDVCIWPEYFAISWRNPRTGALEGLDIDMARALAARLGVQARFVETSFAAFMDRIEGGQCDIAMMAVGITEARARRVDFSAPYLASPIYAVTTSTHPAIRAWADIDRPGHVVAVAAGTVMEPVMRETLRHATLLVVPPPRTREAEVQSGRADVFMSDFPYTRRILAAHAWAKVIDPPGRFGETRYGWALPQGQVAWRAEVNAFLAAIRADGTLDAAAARHDLTPILIRP
ncbi:substrate-binding periplasmic protein [Roseococcus suduntuyensis]|uniref:ABC-type amino acid transport substrate-binding protein n=1 Tax=Roseococcus suduntuyensis TaxID=455361 RepID=A0A840A8S9_9PROT|nr:ABC transporter substrate-binding protein [Roseococcus suduntuyensis]MBB3896936.1 ABC-type amino acid transport substrate-binding protein [Roseococcus suduntuyensis]